MTTVQPSYSEIVKNIIGDVQELLRSELRLLRVELKEDVKSLKLVATLIGAGSLTGLFAIFFALCSIVLALTIVMPAWAAALAVAVSLGLAGGLTLRAGLQRLKKSNLGPDRTVQSIKETVHSIKEEISQ